MGKNKGSNPPEVDFYSNLENHEFTVDSLFERGPKIKQPAKGYRFSIDSLLLAFYSSPRAKKRILDLGTGCGVVSLLLAHRHPDITLFGVEIQPILARIAKINVVENKLEHRIRIFLRNMKTLTPGDLGGAVDMVVTNPPYGKKGEGRTGPDFMKTAAKQEIFANLSDVAQAAERNLKISGRLVIIYPARRLADLFLHLRAVGLEPKVLKTIHPTEDADASRVLLEAVKSGRPGVSIKPPLRIHRKDGSFTEEVQNMFEF